MLCVKVFAIVLLLALTQFTLGTPAGMPAFSKRQFTNSTSIGTSVSGTRARLVARGTGTGAALVARGTGTGAILDARVTGKPAFSKRQFTNCTTTSTSAAGTGAVLLARGTGTGTPYLY